MDRWLLLYLVFWEFHKGLMMLDGFMGFCLLVLKAGSQLLGTPVEALCEV